MFIDFIKAHYKEIIYLGMILILLILDLIKMCRKSFKVVDTVSEKIVKMLPDLIILAESKYGSGSGDTKRLFVLDCVAEWFKTYNIEFTEYYQEFTIKILEHILSTPQKK